MVHNANLSAGYKRMRFTLDDAPGESQAWIREMLDLARRRVEHPDELARYILEFDSMAEETNGN